MMAPVALSRMRVPLGTRKITSSPSLPEQRLPWPGMPSVAVNLRL